VAARSKLSLLKFAGIGCLALLPAHAHAQWWSTRAPVDYEECAERVEKSGVSKDAKTEAIADCDAKFAARRKPGGGYSYYDFMQNRQFDIAGPNPTPAELKQIDEQYTLFLDRQRRNIIAAAFTEKARQQQANVENRAVPLPPEKPAAALNKKPPKAKVTTKVAKCVEHTFDCDFPKLSAGIKDLKKTLFGPPSAKTKRS
jgi:hypothetical protein